MDLVILAGGSGTRFWPLSREATPKQLLKISGGLTMIQQTATRFDHTVEIEDIIIVTNKKYTFDINKQLLDVVPQNSFTIVEEPYARNTATAIGLAAIYKDKQARDAVMTVMPSDHIIQKNDELMKVLKKAEETARKGYLTTLGIIPSKPETGYGYIHQGEILDSGSPDVYEVKQFVEKPNQAKAQQYVESGQYYWNSGIFIWRASDILAAIERYMPELYKGLLEIEGAIGTENEKTVIKNVFLSLQSISIDVGIMEKAPNAAVVPADIGWNDVGSWTALDDIFSKDDHNNVIVGNVVNIDSQNSIVYAEKRLVAVVGLNDMVVVDTPDATLVASKDKAQDVKKVVNVLKEKGSEEINTHLTVERPWGTYTVLEEGDRYKIKRIVVNPGTKLSHQMHHHRSEHWVVVSGTAKITIGDKVFNIHPNESTYVPMSTQHRLENPGKVPLHLIEIQNGEYLKEDDIIRYDDDFGRDKED